MTKKESSIVVSPPNMKYAEFKIVGTGPLVIGRMTPESIADIKEKDENGKSARNKKIIKPRDFDKECNAARYIDQKGWDGFNANAIRSGMISACRLIGFKMTIAKLAVFVIADGWDMIVPQIPLIKIYGKYTSQIDTVFTDNGAVLKARASYHDWQSNVKIRWDADQFRIDDIYNLLSRVGLQVGIGVGRNDSKKSPGLGWGTFTIEKSSLIK